MKEVLFHWVEMRKIEVPDECPTDNVREFFNWLYNNNCTVPFLMSVHEGEKDNKLGVIIIKSDSRDHEIVEVTKDV